MTQVRSTLVRFLLFAVPLAFCVSLTGCESGEAKKPATIDLEPKKPAEPTTGATPAKIK